MLLRDGDERDHGGYNERSEGWEDRRGGGGSHQQSLLRPSYLGGGGGLNFVVKDLVNRIFLGGGSNDTSFTPGRPALMAPPGAMKVMGGAGITENLDRPNMPVNNTIVTLDNYFKQTFSGASAGARAVGGAVKSTVKERRRSGG